MSATGVLANSVSSVTTGTGMIGRRLRVVSAAASRSVDDVPLGVATAAAVASSADTMLPLGPL